MKKIVLFYAIAASIACSCTDMRETPEIISAQIVLTACQEGAPDTKTAVENGGTQVFWEPGDEIKVFSGSRSGRFTSNATGLADVTEFTGYLEGNEPATADIWAVYPYSDEASFDGETITTVIPSVQIARPGTFAQGANVAIAHSTTRSLQFYNVGGGIRFSLTEEGVRKVIFEGLEGEIVSGTVKVGFEEGLPQVKEVSLGSIFITLTPPDGGCFTVGEWYYLTAVPGALNSGFKLRLYKDDDTYGKVTMEKAYTIKRRIFGSVQNINQNMEYEAVTTHFPETEEEWQESVEMTETIAESVNTIIDSVCGDSDDYCQHIQALLTEISRIDGVVSTEVSPNQDAIIIQQDDLTYVNILLKTEGDNNGLNQQFSSLSTAARTQSISSNTPLASSIATSYSKRAILLSPYQNEEKGGTWISDDFVRRLLAYAGFSLTFCPDDKADLDHFSITELSQYDLILIRTHGIANAKTNSGEITTAIATGEEVSRRHNKQFKDKLARCIITPPGDKNTHVRYCITVPWLNEMSKQCGESIQGTFVYVGACQSFLNDDLKDCFFGLGSSVYCGFKETVCTAVANMALFRLLNLMTFGAGLNYASNYFLYNCDDGEKLMTMLTRDGSYDDSYSHLLYDYRLNPNQDITDYYLIDSTPKNLDLTKNGSDVSLKWESVNHQNYDGPDILYYYNDNGNIIPLDIHAAVLSYDYAVFDGDNEVANSTQGACNLTVQNVSEGVHHWYVVAKVMNEDNVVASFKSETVDFTVDVDSNPPAHDYPTPEAVDLGLPSGLKWASCNVGATKPEEYGDYFAWGETEPKSDYSWSTYKYELGTDIYGPFSKYVPNSDYGTVDNKTVLDPEDDAAHANWGGIWRMPTLDEWKELLNNCTWTWTTQNGVNGRKVTGPNGKSIFLPAAGYRDDTDLRSVGSYGNYWSSSLDTDGPDIAYDVYFYSDGCSWSYSSRCLGFSVRPVSE